MSSGKWRPFCLGLNELIDTDIYHYIAYSSNSNKDQFGKTRFRFWTHNRHNMTRLGERAMVCSLWVYVPWRCRVLCTKLLHEDVMTCLEALFPCWRHQMETFSALLAICAGNSPVTGEFPAQRPVTRSFDVFFDLRLNKRSSKQWWGWWFETPSRPLWRHSNAHWRFLCEGKPPQKC